MVGETDKPLVIYNLLGITLITLKTCNHSSLKYMKILSVEEKSFSYDMVQLSRWEIGHSDAERDCVGWQHRSNRGHNFFPVLKWCMLSSSWHLE